MKHITLHSIFQIAKQSLYSLFAASTSYRKSPDKNILRSRAYWRLRTESDVDSRSNKRKEGNRLVWLICQAALGKGKNKLLVRGFQGAEWVFCPLVKSIKRDRISTHRCQGCKHFIRLEQTHIPQTRTIGKTFFLRSATLKGAFHVARPLSKPKITHPHITVFPYVPSLMREREPLIDVFEEKDHIIVLAELPGVNEKNINIKTDEKTLTISAYTSTKKYLRIVQLPAPVKKDAIKYTYRNNILQVRLERL